MSRVQGEAQGSIESEKDSTYGSRTMDRDRSIPFFKGGDTRSVDLRASMTPAASMAEASHESCGRNLPFSVVSSSGQDEDYPAAELNKGIQGRGWQSSRFCFYPQELVLELQWPSRIVNMQLLCHEYKIPSAVEVFVSLTRPWVHSEKAAAQMKRLGYLSMDPNDRSGHQARELKSIHVNSPAAVVRLVFHTSYTNKLNIYNQVGLVALIITGDPLEDNRITQIKKQGFSPLLHTPRKPGNKGTDSTLSAVDSFTATRINRLQQEKVIAVEEEDYDEAKRLKILIDKLKSLGEQIQQLELQKRAAVEREDYDAAKICKLEIEMLRKCDGVLAESLSYPHENQESISNFTEQQRSQGSSIHSLEDVSYKDYNSEIQLTQGNNLSSTLAGKESSTQTPGENAPAQSENASSIPSPCPAKKTANDIRVVDEQPTRVAPSARKDEIEAHDRAASEGVYAAAAISAPLKENGFPVKQRRDVPRKSAAEGSLLSLNHVDPPVHGHQNVRNSIAMPEQNGLSQMQPSSSDDLNAPEPLTEAVKVECGPLFKILDLYHIQCMYSKQWQLRDKAFQFIAKLLESKGVDSSSFRILDAVLIRALNDRVPNVFYSGLQLLKAYVVTYADEIPAKDLQHSSTGFVNILLDKLGDSNARSKDAAAETLMFMASKKELGLDVVARPLLRPVKNQAIWKPVLGRLNWLMVGIPAFGVQPQSRQGFSSEMLMAYVSHAIHSPNGEVRNASVKVITEIYKLMGVTVEKYLKGIKPMIREVLVSNFEKVSLESRKVGDPLTYEEFESIPLPRRTRKHAKYDIEKALENDLQKSTSLEAGDATACDLEPAPLTRKSKQVANCGLHSMVVAQEDRAPEDLQTMYSTEATASVENFSLSPGEDAEEEVLTEGRASQLVCEARQSCRLDADTDASFESVSIANQDCIDDKTQAGKEDELSDQCLFCGKQDSEFLKGDHLDLHFCQKCPMLVGCCNCKQIVEIAALKEHYLSECTSGRRYVECSKCSQAVPKTRFTAHLKSKECRHGKHYKASRCPLCHHAVQPGDAGWRDHLLKRPGCPRNPRTLNTFFGSAESS